MSLEGFIRSMPKVELHVHLVGAITPQRLLALARKNAVPLPVSTVEGMHDWFRFRDFANFIEIYVAASHCIQDQEDLEEVARDFLASQAVQNIRYTELLHSIVREPGRDTSMESTRASSSISQETLRGTKE